MLLNNGHEVVSADNISNGNNNLTESSNNLYCDICDLAWMTGSLQDIDHLDAVVHCAALAHEGLSVFSPSLIVNNIVTGTINTAVLAIRKGCKRFVNCSSMSRYGDSVAPYREDSQCCPVDPYGLAKWTAEGQLEILGKQYGMAVVNAVPHNIYGPRQCYTDPFRNVAAIFANRMLQGKSPIIYGDGQQVRCFSYVEDILPLFLSFLQEDIPHGECFNVGPDYGEAVTIERLWRLIAELIGYGGQPIFHAPRPCEVKVAHCSADKVRRRFNWEPKTSLRDGLVKMIDWIKVRKPRAFSYHLPIEIDSPDMPRVWRERLY
jgi:UDP-glucose 4-epimerase